jgi:hypothetical protein
MQWILKPVAPTVRLKIRLYNFLLPGGRDFGVARCQRRGVSLVGTDVSWEGERVFFPPGYLLPSGNTWTSRSPPFSALF